MSAAAGSQIGTFPFYAALRLHVVPYGRFTCGGVHIGDAARWPQTAPAYIPETAYYIYFLGYTCTKRSVVGVVGNDTVDGAVIDGDLGEGMS